MGGAFSLKTNLPMMLTSTPKQEASKAEGPKPGTIRFILDYSKSVRAVESAVGKVLLNQN